MMLDAKTQQRKCKRKHDVAIMKTFRRNNVFFTNRYKEDESWYSGDWRKVCLRTNQIKEVKFLTVALNSVTLREMELVR